MKRKVCGMAAIAAGVLFLGSCGGSTTSSTSAPTTSQLTDRAFVSNEFSAVLQIVDASQDKLNSHTIATNAGPQTMAVSADKTITMVFNAGNNSLLQVSNATEAGLATATLAGYTDSIAVSGDGKKAYAAIRNGTSSTGTPLGVVAFLDFSAGTSARVDVPLARRLVLSPNGATLLVFSDNSDSVTVIDTAAKTATVVPGFDRPAWGVFANDSTAYILNCGPECGGTTASVTELDNVGTAPTLSTNTPVSAATIGLLDGGTLYVAGTVSPGAGGGRLDVLNASGLTLTRSGVVINDGYHTTMAISSGHLFIGARACSNVAEGCLSIYSTGAGSATIETPKGEVTGMQAVSGRTRVYVVEGGELRIYDSSAGTEIQPPPVNIVGKAWDVKTVD